MGKVALEDHPGDRGIAVDVGRAAICPELGRADFVVGEAAGGQGPERAAVPEGPALGPRARRDIALEQGPVDARRRGRGGPEGAALSDEAVRAGAVADEGRVDNCQDSVPVDEYRTALVGATVGQDQPFERQRSAVGYLEQAELVDGIGDVADEGRVALDPRACRARADHDRAGDVRQTRVGAADLGRPRGVGRGEDRVDRQLDHVAADPLVDAAADRGVAVGGLDRVAQRAGDTVDDVGVDAGQPEVTAYCQVAGDRDGAAVAGTKPPAADG